MPLPKNLITGKTAKLPGIPGDWKKQQAVKPKRNPQFGAALFLDQAITKRCPAALADSAFEYKFHPTRKWRVDLAYPQVRVGIEIHGSVWQQGRHTRGKGFINDRAKMNAAQKLGWVVLEFSADVLEKEWGRCVDEICEVINERAKHHGSTPGKEIQNDQEIRVPKVRRSNRASDTKPA
jgi:very-short-patch-repair endonuclease